MKPQGDHLIQRLHWVGHHIDDPVQCFAHLTRRSAEVAESIEVQPAIGHLNTQHDTVEACIARRANVIMHHGNLGVAEVEQS